MNYKEYSEQYDSFINEVTQKIKDFLPESYRDANITVENVTKNNKLKDVKEIINSKDTAEHIKKIADDIAKECKMQQLDRFLPER